MFRFTLCINTFKNHTKIKKGHNLGETYEIILEPHKGKWIPTLANSKLKTIDNKDLVYNKKEDILNPHFFAYAHDALL